MTMFKREPTYGEYIRQDPEYIKALRKILKKHRFPRNSREFDLGHCRYHLEDENLPSFTLGGGDKPTVVVTTESITVNGTTVWQK